MIIIIIAYIYIYIYICSRGSGHTFVGWANNHLNNLHLFQQCHLRRRTMFEMGMGNSLIVSGLLKRRLLK